MGKDIKPATTISAIEQVVEGTGEFKQWGPFTDIEVLEMEGYVSEADNDVTVVLDTNLTPELIEEGFVREIISKIQTMRKEAGFEVMDKIQISLADNQVIEGIFRVHEKEIKSEVLAENVVYNEVSGYTKEWKINSENVKLGVEKLS